MQSLVNSSPRLVLVMNPGFSFFKIYITQGLEHKVFYRDAFSSDLTGIDETFYSAKTARQNDFFWSTSAKMNIRQVKPFTSFIFIA